MSIRPSDFQVMMPKTLEVSKIHNDEAQRNIASQQQQASLVQHKANNDLRQVHSQDSAHPGRIREKQEKRQGSERQDKKEKKENGSRESGSREKPAHRTSTIDIRL